MTSLDANFHEPEDDEDEPRPRKPNSNQQDDDDDDPSSDEDHDDDEQPEEIQRFLELFGATRGTTGDELREWHKEWATTHPKTGDPPPADCKAGCHWKDSEFSMGCVACMEASTAITET